MRKPPLTRAWLSPAIATRFVLVAALTPGFARADPVGTIHACYKSNSGDLRLVQGEADCHPNEVAISWNAVGPSGAPGSIAARIRDEGPITLTPHETSVIPLSGETWMQRADEFQELVGQIQVDTPCPGFATAVVPLIRVFLDGVERVTMRVTQPLSEFRFPSFEPGVEVEHTLVVTVTERNCTGPHIVQSVKVNALGAGGAQQ